MSVKSWGHNHPSSLTDFLQQRLIALAAIVGSAHDVFGADAEEDEGGAADVGVLLVALLILGAFLVAAVRS